MTSNPEDVFDYKVLYETTKSKLEEAEKDRAELLKKYNTCAADRANLLDALRGAGIAAFAKLLGDLQNIGFLANKFEPLQVDEPKKE